MIKNVYLFQPQHEILVGGVPNFWIPYSAGCIWSYVQQFEEIVDHFSLKNIFFKRDCVESVLSKIENPSVVGFSCYIWNQNYCLGLAEEIKNRWPNCFIIFGGPQVSGRFLHYPFIDSLVMAEGEEAFLEILRCLKHNIPPEQIYSRKRLENLDIPSPYITGVFDRMISDYPDYVWATTLETNRGCPFACTFCDWGGVTYSKIKKFSLDRIVEELKWISNHKVAYLACADANFGIFKERDLEIARLMRSAADQGFLDTINLQYAKNSTDAVFEIARVLGPYNRGITVSVQSMNPDTLVAIKRSNLEINDISNMMKLSSQEKIITYTEVILGLPLETLDTWKKGLCQLLELGQHQSIDLSFTEILENSELATLESRSKYGLKTILAKNFYHLTTDDFPEIGEIVVSTNTMTRDDILEGYLYAWMIIHFHIYGHTQLLAKYLRNIKSVHYRDYYDEVFSIFEEDRGPIGDHFREMKKTIENYLQFGEMKSSVIKTQRGDILHFASHEFFFNHKHLCTDLGLKAFEKFCNDVHEIEPLQRYFMYDNNQDLPITLDSKIDINEWKHKNTKYQISNSIIKQKEFLNSKNKEADIDFWALRRKNLVKNSIDKI